MALMTDQARSSLSDDAIVERIVNAVMEQRLRAGAKLPESVLCDAFQCNRTQIRRILVVLAERGVVTLHANRGAFVSSPDATAAHEVFEARRAVERSIVLLAVERIEESALEGLRANVRAGAAAEARGDRSQSISAFRRISSPPGGGRRQFGPDKISRGACRAHVIDHRSPRLAQHAFLLRN